jgi:hypothetical protein
MASIPTPNGSGAIAQSMKYQENDEYTGFMTTQVYHERSVRSRLENILGVRVTRWDTDPDEGNGSSMEGFREVPTRKFPVFTSTSPGRHHSGDLSDQGHPVRLWNVALAAQDYRLAQCALALRCASPEDDAGPLAALASLAIRRNAIVWIEVDRVGYRFNRMVAYPSAVLHSATKHFGSNVDGGRIYQTFRLGRRLENVQVSEIAVDLTLQLNAGCPISSRCST